MPRFLSRGSATPVDDSTESRTRGHSRCRVVENPGTLCRNTFPRKVRGTADPSAAVGMTKGMATLPWRAVAEQKPFSSPLGGPQAHGPTRRAPKIRSQDSVFGGPRESIAFPEGRDRIYFRVARQTRWWAPASVVDAILCRRSLPATVRSLQRPASDCRATTRER